MSSVGPGSHEPGPRHGEVPSALHRPTNNANQWRERLERHNGRRLAEERYRLFAVIATFSASVQAQLMGCTPDSGDLASQVTNALYISGLLADMFGAILCFGSARWFEMLTREEEDILHRNWSQNIAEGAPRKVERYSVIDRWVSLSIVIGQHAVVLGLALCMLGFMVYIWTQQPMIVRVPSTSVFIVFAIFLPPFALWHRPANVIALLNLRRRPD